MCTSNLTVQVLYAVLYWVQVGRQPVALPIYCTVVTTVLYGTTVQVQYIRVVSLIPAEYCSNLTAYRTIYEYSTGTEYYSSVLLATCGTVVPYPYVQYVLRTGIANTCTRTSTRTPYSTGTTSTCSTEYGSCQSVVYPYILVWVWVRVRVPVRTGTVRVQY